MKIHTRNTPWRGLGWVIVALTVLLLLGLAGCGGGQVKAVPLSDAEIASLTGFMTTIERRYANIEQLTIGQVNALQTELGFGPEQVNSKDADTRTQALYLQGYAQEYTKQYAQAIVTYRQAVASKGKMAAQATYRIGVLGANNLLGPDSLKIAKAELRALEYNYDKGEQRYRVVTRAPALAGDGGIATYDPQGTGTTPAFVAAPMARTAQAQLDVLYRTGGGTDTIYYNAVDAFIGAFKRISPQYGVVLALIALALLVKVVTIPLTTASFRGMRDMQRVQPILKELQEKYKDDKQKLAEEQMKVMQEHKVNPAGGCLPMLIQLPIFIVVYQAVQVYSAQFASSHFLWISDKVTLPYGLNGPNLASPDYLLLGLYAISMIISQKLTATPTTDPQQKAMQVQMTYLMPIILVFVLASIASAFVLYWFFLNVFSAAHQYYLMRKFAAEDAKNPATAVIEQTPKGKKGK